MTRLTYKSRDDDRDDDKVEFSTKLEKMNKDVHSALSELKNHVDGKNADTVKNVEAFFSKYEDENRKYARQLADAEKKAREAEELAEKGEKRIKEIEHKLASRGNDETKSNFREGLQYKSFMKYVAKGEPHLSNDEALELKTLRTDRDSSAGVLIPELMDSEMRKNITEFSPVRAFARNRPMPIKTMTIVKRLRGIDPNGARFEGEAESGTTGGAQYGSDSVTAYRQTHTVPATQDMLMSSAFDLEREIMSEVEEYFTLGESRAFLTGTGNKGPQGILHASAGCEVVDTATSATLKFTDLAEISGRLKRGQRPMFFFNRRTLSALWKVVDTTGQPIWAPAKDGSAATIYGFGYNSDMIHLEDAQNGSGAKPILFGDLYRGYEIFDMTGTTMIRDDYSKKAQAIVEWTFHRYLTGQVIMPEAIKILRIQ